MSVYYKPTDLHQLYIFSGVQLNPIGYLKDSGLKGDAFKAELVKVTQAYQADKKNINLSVGKVISILDNNSIPFENQGKIGAKLEEISKKEISVVDSSSCFITKFFMRLMGLIKGRGFNTVGEYGVERAQSLISARKSGLIKELNKTIDSDEQLTKTLVDRIDSLSDADFTDVMNKAFFNKIRGTSFTCTKFAFYDLLSVNRQILFRDLISQTKNPYAQVYDVIADVFNNSTIFDSNEFKGNLIRSYALAQSIVDKFMEMPRVTGNSGQEDKYIQLLVEFSIQKLLKDKNFPKLRALIDNYGALISNRALFVLTKEEALQLSNNLK
jgi:hypothetical protein